MFHFAVFKKEKKQWLLVFAFFISLFWLSNSGRDTSEGEFHYAVAKLFVETGEIGFDYEVEGIFTKAPNGKFYASHEFGNILPLIPTAALNHLGGICLKKLGASDELVLRAQQFVVSMQPGVYGAATLAFLFSILRDEYGLDIKQAAISVILVGLGTFFWTYSRNLFDGVLCSLLLIASISCLLKFRRTASLAHLASAFILLGYAVDTRLSMVIGVVAAFFFIYAAGLLSRKIFAISFLSLAPFAIWQLWYNKIRTGNLLVSPVQTYQYAANNSLDGDLLLGLFGLTFSPGKSLFVYSPILLLSIFGFKYFWRRDLALSVFVSVFGLLWWILHAKLRSWYGAWGWGPRHFVTVVPLLAIPGLIALPKMWSTKVYQKYIIGIALSGFILAFASIISNWHYRMGLALQEGRLNDKVFVWSAFGNQAADMVTGSLHNFEVLLGNRNPDLLKGASEMNQYASNRINVWWFNFPHFGVPLFFVVPIAFCLAFIMCWSGFSLYRACRS